MGNSDMITVQRDPLFAIFGYLQFVIGVITIFVGAGLWLSGLLIGPIGSVIGLIGLMMSFDLLGNNPLKKKRIQMPIVYLNMSHAIFNVIGIGWILLQDWYADWTQTSIPLLGGFFVINLLFILFFVREIRRIR